ncbi:MAG: hemolysin expression modulating protein [Nitrosomonas sp.]|nr:MAG: hemolysin expression modulating protein [Nitrosomonas sp.]
MAVRTSPRPNLGSGSIKFIDGFGFEGIGSAGFDDDDLLIIGDDLDNILEGGSGHDEIEGGGGNDIIRGGDGNGILKGDDGDDDLDGQEGTEKLFGGNGDDILRAGGSKPVIIELQDGKRIRKQGDFDRLTGGEGNDTFGFYGYGSFEISDFKVGEDLIFFDSDILGIHSLTELSAYITNITPGVVGGTDTPYFEVEFIGGAATIKVVGASIDEITADMVIFNLP